MHECPHSKWIEGGGTQEHQKKRVGSELLCAKTIHRADMYNMLVILIEYNSAFTIRLQLTDGRFT